MTVRYEDLRTEPGSTLRRIGTELGVNVEQVVDRIENQEAMSTGVGLSGNRMRRGTLEFVFDMSPSPKEGPIKYEKTCELVTYPLRKKYGYT